MLHIGRITYHPIIDSDGIEIIFNDTNGYYCGYFSVRLNCLFFNNFGVLSNKDITRKNMIEYIKNIGFKNIIIK